jgi:nucleotide-binding universal stress UspA family protein
MRPRLSKEGQTMKRILVADDGSEHALKAVETAAELAANTGAELIALAVVDPNQVRAADIFALARSAKVDDGHALEQLVAALAQHLERSGEVAAKVGVDRVHKTRRDGSDVTLEIIDCARAYDVDLIVVGTRGRSRLPGLLLGSVSQKLASHAPCPVLIAR